MTGTNFANDAGNGYVQSNGFSGPQAAGNPATAAYAPAFFPGGTLAAVATYTAYAGGGKTNATPLTTEYANVGTVATLANSVLLEPAVAGTRQVVTNNGAYAMQVFGQGTDTIDGAATGVGVSQAAGSTVQYVSTVTGAWATIGDLAGGDTGILLVSTATGITAYSGGGQTSAVLLTAQRNQVNTVAAAAASVKLQPAVVGLEQWVLNSAGSNAMQVFGSGTDTINGVATGTGVSVAAGKLAQFTCYAAGAWYGPLAEA